LPDVPLLLLEHLTGSDDRDLALSKFLARVRKTKYCWEWLGTKTAAGYGKFNFKRGMSPQMAHRLSYVLFKGPFPKKLNIDHKCRNKSCVNPDHLEPVTKAENNLRSFKSRRKGKFSDKCPNGHDYTEATAYMDPRGGRQCRICRREAVYRCLKR
jgi:hypothetical protein